MINFDKTQSQFSLSSKNSVTKDGKNIPCKTIKELYNLITL